MVNKADVALIVGGGVVVAVVGGVATHWFTKRMDGLIDAFGNVVTAPIQAGKDLGQGLSGVPTLTRTGAPSRVNPPGNVLLQRAGTPTGTVDYQISIPTPVFEPSHVVITTPHPQVGALNNYSYAPTSKAERVGRFSRNAYTQTTEVFRVGFNKTKPVLPYLVPNAGARLLYKNIKGWF